MASHDSPLGVGIIGFGGFGQFLRRSWAELRSVDVRAVADSNTSRRPPDLPFYSDWTTLLADESVDLISIASPPSTHAEMACAAMQAGKHVLIEKPLATTIEDAKRVRQAQHETGRIAAVDYMLRFNPIVETLQSWSRSRTFGPLRRVIVENYAQDDGLPADHWFWNLDVSGGILVEHAVHFIDVVNGCTDAEPGFVDGLALEREDGRVDRMGLTVVYEDGLAMQQYHSFSRPGYFEDTSMRFVFDLMQVDLHGWIPLTGSVTALVSGGNEDHLRQLPGWSVTKRSAIGSLPDVSRPEGWGTAAATGSLVYSGGREYEVDTMVEGRLSLSVSKTDAYASALRQTMADVVAAARDPMHALRVGVREGERSLKLALEATRKALGSRDQPRNERE